MHYVNIATPAVWDLTEVIYIDLDPDVLRKYGSEKIIIADEYEFEQHKIEYKYPKNLIHTTIGNNIVVFKRK